MNGINKNNTGRYPSRLTRTNAQQQSPLLYCLSRMEAGLCCERRQEVPRRPDDPTPHYVNNHNGVPPVASSSRYTPVQSIDPRSFFGQAPVLLCPLSGKPADRLDFPVRASDGGIYEWTYFQSQVRAQLIQSNTAVSVLNHRDRLIWVKPALRNRKNLNVEVNNIQRQISNLSHQLSNLIYVVQAENGQVYDARALYRNLYENKIPTNRNGTPIRWVMPYKHRSSEPPKVENTTYVQEMNNILSGGVNAASVFVPTIPHSLREYTF